jgi:hypothetical protein
MNSKSNERSKEIYVQLKRKKCKAEVKKNVRVIKQKKGERKKEDKERYAKIEK